MVRNAKSGRNDLLNYLVAGAAVLAIGVGTATAAISVGGEQAGSNPAARPLTIARGAVVTPAYGPEDEDCVRVARRAIGLDGKFHMERTVECIE